MVIRDLRQVAPLSLVRTMVPSAPTAHPWSPTKNTSSSQAAWVLASASWRIVRHVVPESVLDRILERDGSGSFGRCTELPLAAEPTITYMRESVDRTCATCSFGSMVTSVRVLPASLVRKSSPEHRNFSPTARSKLPSPSRNLSSSG